VLALSGRKSYSAQQELIETQQQTLQLVEENQSLQEKYATELEEQYQELKQAKDQLALSEKLSTLGQLAAGIIHEINSPLGVSKAALQQTQPLLAQMLSEEYAQIAQDESALLLAKPLIEAMTQKAAPALSTREERALRKHYTAYLETNGFNSADVVSEQLILAGFQAPIEDFHPVFTHTLRERLVQFTYTTALVYNNLHNAGVAMDKIALIVRALKKYAYAEKGSERERLNLSENVQTIVILYAYQIKLKAQVHTTFVENCFVLANSDELGQVWTNLITNALHALPDRGGELYIEVAAVTEAGTPKVRCTITDTGSGIPAEVLPRIFDAFYTTKPKGVGTGLGLSLCKEIVEKYGGSLVVASVPGRTTFTASFPAV